MTHAQKCIYRRYADPSEFESVAWDYLYAEEGLNTVALGVIRQLQETPPRYDRHFLATMSIKDKLVGVAIMTPPYPFNLYVTDPAAIDAGLQFLLSIDKPKSILGIRSTAEVLAHKFCDETGATIASTEAQGIYELNKVSKPRPCHGNLRLARDDDRATVVKFIQQFSVDIDDPVDLSLAEPVFDRWLQQSCGYVWETTKEEIVGMAAVSRKTKTGACVSYVYTEPRSRGQGIASNIVADLSQRLLDSGKSRIFLYTQMKNPTSNKIYQAVGYRKVADSVKIELNYQT